MSIPLTFDARRAASGEPIQFCKTDGAWVDVHFVGLTRNGTPLVQFDQGDTIQSHALRMKPMPRKLWVLEFNNPNTAAAAHLVLRNCEAKWIVPDVREIEVPHADA